MKIIEKEFNAITGEEIISERKETAEEKAQRESIEAADLARKADEEAKLVQKQAIANRLGVTLDELKLLLG
jgi:hypothetical protein